MSVVAAAIIGSAVVGGVSMYMSSESQSEASDRAVEAQEKMSNENLALQKELSDQQRSDFEPWRNVGESALQSIQQGIESGEFIPEEFDPSQIDLKQDPGYQFRLDQGIEARDKSAAARGSLLSGAQAKAIEGYGQNLASQEYGNAYARYVDQYSREADRRAKKYNILSHLSGQGQASAAKQAGATGQLAATSGNIMQNLGGAQAQNAINQGNVRAGMYQSGAQVANQAAQNWLTYKQTGGK